MADRTILTNAGRDLFNRVLAGDAEIQYTKVVFSSENDLMNKTDDQLEQLTDVQPQEVTTAPVVYKAGVNQKDPKEINVDVRGVTTNEDVKKGYYVNIYALYATDGNNEILYSFALDSDPNSGYVPPYDGVTPQYLSWTWQLGVNSTNNIHFDNRATIFMTIDDLKDVQAKLSKINIQNFESRPDAENHHKQLQSEIDNINQNLETKSNVNNYRKQLENELNDLKNNEINNKDINELKNKIKMLEGQTPATPQLSANMDTSNGTITYKITQPSKQDAGQVYQYFVYYKNVNDQNYQETSTVNTTDTITGLDGHQKYNIYVVAQNAAGLSDQSNTVTTDSIDGRIFGVTSQNISNPQLQRTDAAQGMVAGVNGDRNDFDSAGVWKQMHRVTDSLGNVFVRIPKFYIYKRINGNAITIKVSLSKISNDWYLPKCFWDFQNDCELPYVDVGAYDASDNGNNGLASTTGSAPLVNTSLNDFRTKAQNVGTGYQLLDIHVVDVIQCLFVVEFATLNSQSIMEGNDTSYGIINNGQTDNGVGSSRTNGSGSTAMNYRGIENLYGNIFQWVDGISNNGSQLFVCDDPSAYQSSVFANPYNQVGYSQPNFDIEWVSQMGYDPNHPEVTTPVASNGSDSSYWCDAGSVGGNNCNAFCIGGSCDNASDDGLFEWDDNVPYAQNDVGSRLIKRP